MPLVGQHTQLTAGSVIRLWFLLKQKQTVSNVIMIFIKRPGPDCSRCHIQVSWLVNNINEIHQKSRFPLLGAHRTADCSQCHKSESLLRYDVTGVNCIDCHREIIWQQQIQIMSSQECQEDCSSCHPVNAFQWTGAGFNHNVFPLVQGHSQ